MHRLTKLAARLYPRWWRERYGEEFAALLEEARPGFRGTLDIAKSALAMQLTTYSRKRVILAGTLAGLLVSYAVALSIKPQYASIGRVVLMVRDSTEAAPRLLGNAFQPLATKTLSRSNLAEIVTKLNLYPTERSQQPLDQVLDTMQRNTSISMETRATNSATVAIRFEYPEPRKALLTTDALIAAFQKANRKMPEGTPAPKIFSMRTTLPAVVPRLQCRQINLLGVAFGSMLGSGLAIILHFRRKSPKLTNIGPPPKQRG